MAPRMIDSDAAKERLHAYIIDGNKLRIADLVYDLVCMTVLHDKTEEDLANLIATAWKSITVIKHDRDELLQ